jgi:hypothetical protein
MHTNQAPTKHTAPKQQLWKLLPAYQVTLSDQLLLELSTDKQDLQQQRLWWLLAANCCIMAAAGISAGRPCCTAVKNPASPAAG